MPQSGEQRAPSHGARRTWPARAGDLVRASLRRYDRAPILVAMLFWIAISTLAWVAVAAALQAL